MPLSQFSATVTPFAILALLCLTPAVSTAAAPQYTLQDLGTLTPGGSAQPQGINQAGDVFGHASPASAYTVPDHVFFWSVQGGMVDIGSLPYSGTLGFDQTQAAVSAVAMNDHGQITGEAEIGTNAAPFYQPISHAFVWTPATDNKSGAMQELGVLGLSGDTNSSTSAVAINSRGQIIGLENPNNYTPEGFLWTPGGTDGTASNPQLKDLGQFQPSLLDNEGRVVGLLNGVVTLYNGHTFVSLGDPPGFDPNGVGYGYRLTFQRLDVQGNIYGFFATPTADFTPFVWTPTKPSDMVGAYVVGVQSKVLTDAEVLKGSQLFWSNENVFAFDPQKSSISAVDLGGLLFDTIHQGNLYFPRFDTYVSGRNTFGDLVGLCQYNDTLLAFVEHAGLMYDLNRHTQGPGAEAYQLLEAKAINDSGQIVVLSQSAAATPYFIHAVVLTPAGQAPPVAPTIQLIQPQPPDAGDPDQTVDIQGTGFQVGTVVTYDGKPLAATVYAETQILATIPSASLTAGTHTIKVTNPDSRAGSGSYVVLPVRPVPSLTSVHPASLPAGSPDTAITLTGTGLYPETQVGYGYGPQNDMLLTVISASADHTQIMVRLPASAMTQGTTLTFYAATPGQRGDAANAPAPVLIITNPVPTITSISPTSVVADTTSGFTLTVNGSHFVPGTHVIWDGAYAVTQYVSPTQVTAIIYASFLNGIGPDLIPPGSVPVQVVNPAPGGGSASTTQIFTDGPYPAPTLTSVDPGVVAPGMSGYLFLNGSHFLHHSVVHIGSLAFPFSTYGNYLSPDRTQITLYLPASAFPTVGVYPVTVVNSSAGGGGGTSTVQYVTVQGPSLRVSGATLSRDPATQQIIAQVTLAAGPGTDAQGITLSQASLGTASATMLPPAVGTIAAGTTAIVTLRFPDSAAIFGIPAVLRVSGRYSGGSFVSSRRVSF